MMLLENLFVMQDDLRHWDKFQSMIQYVSEGGFWTPKHLIEYASGHKLKTSPIIQISRFENNYDYIHDGHHRCIATYLGGRNYLREDEYHVREWKYEQYLEISHTNGWYTPFDPRVHLRTADFGLFKQEARERFMVDPVQAEQWIRNHIKNFRRDRIFGVMPELAEVIKCRLLKGSH